MYTQQAFPAADPRYLQQRIAHGMSRARRPLPAPRRRWYILAGLASVGLINALALAYAVLTPTSYVSQMSMILPGAGSTVSMTLESIGQTSSNPSQAYSPAISPRVVYKELIGSDPVLDRAAQLVDMPTSSFARPRIRLIEETSLLMIDLSGSTPENAKRRAEGLVQAFNMQLDILRRDELEKRTSAVKGHLKSYQDQVDAARQRIAETQRQSGLVSVAHFNEISSSVVLAQRKLADLKADLERMAEEQVLLTGRLGVDPAIAGVALKLSADASFAKQVTEFADANAQDQYESRRLGPANPVLIAIRKKKAAALAEIVHQIATVGGDTLPTGELERLALLLNSSHHADLIKRLVGNEASIRGKRQEANSLEADIRRQQAEVRAMRDAAARLEDLRKDHLVAEAVLTSAIARLDTSKADIYGSYPLVQMLSPPSLPFAPTQPKPMLALAGAVVGSLLAILAWTLAWRQHLFVHRRRKNG